MSLVHANRSSIVIVAVAAAKTSDNNDRRQVLSIDNFCPTDCLPHHQLNARPLVHFSWIQICCLVAAKYRSTQLIFPFASSKNHVLRENGFIFFSWTRLIIPIRAKNKFHEQNIRRRDQGSDSNRLHFTVSENDRKIRRLH